MTTNVQIISDALRDINVISEIDSPSAEQGSHALRQLNHMMDLWRLDDCDLGYFKQTSTTATCPIPEWSEGGVKSGLALFLATTYGASLSPEFVVKAEELINAVKRRCLIEKLEGADMSHLPIGDGKRRRGNSILTDQ